MSWFKLGGRPGQAQRDAPPAAPPPTAPPTTSPSASARAPAAASRNPFGGAPAPEASASAPALSELRQAFVAYELLEDEAQRDARLPQLLPRFLAVFGRLPPAETLRLFRREALQSFAMHAARYVVKLVRRLAADQSTEAASLRLVTFLADDAAGQSAVRTLLLLAAVGDVAIEPMASMALPSTLVKCLYLFLDLPPPPVEAQPPPSPQPPPPQPQQPQAQLPRPAVPSTTSSGPSSPTKQPQAPVNPFTGAPLPSSALPASPSVKTNPPPPLPPVTPSPAPAVPTTIAGRRAMLEEDFTQLLCRLFQQRKATQETLSAVDAAGVSDVARLFDLVITPCAPHNYGWRRTAMRVIATMFTHTLDTSLIAYVHKRGLVKRTLDAAVLTPDFDLETRTDILECLIDCLYRSSLARGPALLLEEFGREEGYSKLAHAIMMVDAANANAAATTSAAAAAAASGCLNDSSMGKDDVRSPNQAPPALTATSHGSSQANVSLSLNTSTASVHSASAAGSRNTSQLPASPAATAAAAQSQAPPSPSSPATSFLRRLVMALGRLVFAGQTQPRVDLPKDALQDPTFRFPQPQGFGVSVRNIMAFHALQRVLLQSPVLATKTAAMDVIFDIVTRDQANYFLLRTEHTLEKLFEKLESVPDTVRSKALTLLEFVVCSLNFVPAPELKAMRDKLKSVDSKISTACFLTLIKLVNFNIRYADVCRDLGILDVIIDRLLITVKQLKELSSTAALDALSESHSNPTNENPFPEHEGQKTDEPDDHSVLMDCLALLLGSNAKNVEMFRSHGGARAVYNMVALTAHRWHALRVAQQLILCDDPLTAHDDLATLLELMQSTPPQAYGLKIDILRTVMRLFALDDRTKHLFRMVHGFVYVMHALVMLGDTVKAAASGSFLPSSTPDKTENVRRRKLDLLRTILHCLTTALQNCPLNYEAFAAEVRYETLADSIRVSGVLQAADDGLEACQSLLLMATEAFGRDEDFKQKALPLKNASVVAEVVLPLLVATAPATQAAILKKVLVLARSEANAQGLAQAGATLALVTGFGTALLQTSHALHATALELFTLLGAQSLTPQELRHFLRLDALHMPQVPSSRQLEGSSDEAALDDTVVEPLLAQLRDKLSRDSTSDGNNSMASTAGTATPLSDHESSAAKPLASPSLPTTSLPNVPKQHLQALLAIARAQEAASGVPFMEFAMTAPLGYASVFLPSVAQLQRTMSGAPARETAVERIWPPVNGLTLSCWVCVERWGLDSHPIRLLTAFSPSEPDCNLLAVEVEPMRSFVMLRTTDEVAFPHAILGTGSWHHVALSMRNRGRGKQTQAVVFIDGVEVDNEKAPYPGTGPPQAANSDVASQICFRIGTTKRERTISPLVWRCAAWYFFEEPLTAATIQALYELGPSYCGQLQGSLGLYQGWPLATAPEPRVYGHSINHKVTDHPALQSPLRSRGKMWSLDLAAVQTPAVPAERVWVSLHAHAKVQVSPETAVQIMGGPMAGSVFGRNTDMQKGGGLMRSLRNGGQYPPYGHLTGEARVFAGQTLAMSLDQVGGVALCLKMVADADSPAYLEAALQLLVLLIKQCGRNARDMRDDHGFQILAGILMARHKLMTPQAYSVLLELIVNTDAGPPHIRLVCPEAAEMLLAQDLWRPVKNEDMRRMVLSGIRDMAREVNSYSETNIRWLKLVGLVPTLIAILHETALDRVVREDAANVLFLALNSNLAQPELKLLCESCLSTLAPMSGVTASAAAVGRHLCLGVLARLANSSVAATTKVLEDFMIKAVGVEWPLMMMADGMDETTVVLALRFLGALLKDAGSAFAQRFRPAAGGFAALGPALGPHVCSSEVQFLLLALLLGRALEEVPERVALSVVHVQEVFQLQQRNEVPIVYNEVAVVLLYLLRVLYGMQFWRVDSQEEEAAGGGAIGAAAAPLGASKPPTDERNGARLEARSVSGGGAATPTFGGPAAPFAPTPRNPFLAPPNPSGAAAMAASSSGSSPVPPISLNPFVTSMPMVTPVPTSALDDPFKILGVGSPETEVPHTLVREMTLLYNRSTAFAQVCQQPEFMEAAVQALFVPERIAERTVAETMSLASVISRLVERQDGIRLCFTLKQPSQEALMALISVVMIDYMETSKDKTLPLLDALLDAAPTNAAAPARFYFAFLQCVLKDLVETEALVNLPQQDSRLMQNLPRLLTAVVDRLVAEGTSTLCAVTMSLMGRLLKQVVDEQGAPFPFAVNAHGQATVQALCQTAFRCLSRSGLYALLRAIDETEGGWIDLGTPPETPTSGGTTPTATKLGTEVNDTDLAPILAVFSTLTQQSGLLFSDGNADSRHLLALMYHLLNLMKHADLTLRDKAAVILQSLFVHRARDISPIIGQPYDPRRLESSFVSSFIESHRAVLLDAGGKAWMSLETAPPTGKATRPLLKGTGGTALLANLATATRLPRRSRPANGTLDAVRSALAQQLPRAQLNTERRVLRREHRNVVSARFVADSWEELQCNLARERGLWGLDAASALDRWQLDTNEGPARVRRRLRPNPGFYVDYPYRRDRLTSATVMTMENSKRKNVPMSHHAWPFFKFYLLPVLQTPHGQALLLAQLRRALSTASETYADEAAEVQLLRLLLRPVVTAEPLMSTCCYALMQTHRSVDLLSLDLAGGVEDANKGYDDNNNDDIGDSEASAMASGRPRTSSGGNSSQTLAAAALASAAGSDTQSRAERDSVIGGAATPQPATPSLPSVAGSDRSQLSLGTAGNAGSGSLNLPPGVGPHHNSEVSHPVVLRVLEPGEIIQSKWRCSLVTGLDIARSVLFLCRGAAYLLQGLDLDSHDNIIDAGPNEYSIQDAGEKFGNAWGMGLDAFTRWNYDSMRDIRRGRYLLQDRALELFSSDGENTLITFTDTASRDRVYMQLCGSAQSLAVRSEDSVAGVHRDAKVEQASFFATITGEKTVTQRWENGEISNFQYLMSLNTLAGRSYNDMNQYPVFPWVLKDYSSMELDLIDPATYRDLSKPMGAQTPARAEGFKLRYEAWEDPMGEGIPAFHYGTHYSSAAAVASFLVRLEPFSKLFCKLQGGHFDHADRMFHSIQEAWESASERSNADVKELTPEFFYLPEFLVNANNFDLGTKQNGVTLDDVELPPWAKGDPHEFIRLHRAALESDHVSANLHHWIDLIFGFKQQGEEAVKALNVFHHLTYEGAVNIDEMTDPVQRQATIGIITNFGQTPRQLFKKPHPPKKMVHRPLGPRALTASACVDGLVPSAHPLKVIKAAVGEIVMAEGGKLCVAAMKQRLWPPNYARCLDFSQSDGSVVSFDVGTEREDTAFYEGLHPGPITCALAPSNRMLVTGGLDTTVRVWGLSGRRQRLQLRKTLCGHSAAVTALASAASFHTLVSGGEDETCIVWDLNRLRYLRTLKGHGGAIRALAVNSTTGDIVVCTRDAVFLWSLNGTFVARTPSRLASNTGAILCCCLAEAEPWSRDTVYFTGHEDGKIRMWELHYRRTDMAARAALQLPNLRTTMGSGSPVCEVGAGAGAGAVAGLAAAGEPLSLDPQVMAEMEAAAKNASCLTVLSRTELSTLPPDERVEVWDRELRVLNVLVGGAVAVPSADAAGGGGQGAGQAGGSGGAAMGGPMSGGMAVGDGEPITALSVSNDHGKLYSGDAAGKVWSWTLPDVAGRSNDHWVKDSSVATCMGCNVRFTITERRHHCRSCGGVYCNKCSRREMPIPSLNLHKPVRVCDKCFAALEKQQGLGGVALLSSASLGGEVVGGGGAGVGVGGGAGGGP